MVQKVINWLVTLLGTYSWIPSYKPFSLVFLFTGKIFLELRSQNLKKKTRTRRSLSRISLPGNDNDRLISEVHAENVTELFRQVVNGFKWPRWMQHPQMPDERKSAIRL